MENAVLNWIFRRLIVYILLTLQILVEYNYSLIMKESMLVKMIRENYTTVYVISMGEILIHIEWVSWSFIVVVHNMLWIH